ncbi:hypothetical protein HELRODRAFT_176982 [Helobdella robusta]|uniref:Uncharacterized protein n=1 Tax=Helobdella robusta TaxID=6412 RepID=T1FB34_HELRO|nr:hypothetical protein HELRODRAFT_176982 [Helobdella robusta]ESN98505.1 hypothetical protein HELRODRAFT_176982 [Helobdella robusta]
MCLCTLFNSKPNRVESNTGNALQNTDNEFDDFVIIEDGKEATGNGNDTNNSKPNTDSDSVMVPEKSSGIDKDGWALAIGSVHFRFKHSSTDSIYKRETDDNDGHDDNNNNKNNDWGLEMKDLENYPLNYNEKNSYIDNIILLCHFYIFILKM